MLEKLMDLFRKYYIFHEDLQTPSNGVAYFGPFRGWEISKRMYDEYADFLVAFGWLEEVRIPRDAAGEMYINPRSYWMEHLKSIREQGESTRPRMYRDPT